MTRWAAALGVVVAVLLLVVALTQRATRATLERDAAQDRVEVLKDAKEIEDEVDDLARDGDALRRELDSRLSGVFPPADALFRDVAKRPPDAAPATIDALAADPGFAVWVIYQDRACDRWGCVQ